MAISESATLQTAKLFINHCSSLAIAMIDADAPDPAVSSKNVEISWMQIRVRHDNAQAARSFLRAISAPGRRFSREMWELRASAHLYGLRTIPE
jgi:hypothetical protein